MEQAEHRALMACAACRSARGSTLRLTRKSNMKVTRRKPSCLEESTSAVTQTWHCKRFIHSFIHCTAAQAGARGCCIGQASSIPTRQ